MTEVAKLIADMVRAGVDPELIGRAAAALAEREPVRVVDEQAERKRAADRERMRIKREAEKDRAMSRDIADERDTSLSSPEVSPQTPFPKPHLSIPPSPPKGGSSPAEVEFAEFWDSYPNKTGKAAARPKFVKARKGASFQTIMAGLRRYVAKTDDRPWCNPATWLHQERWADEPPSQPRGSPSRQPPPKPDHFKAYAEELDGQDRSQGSDSRYWDDAQGVPVLTIDYERR